MPESLKQLVEAYYTPADLAALWRFSDRKIRDLAKADEFTVRTADGVIIAEVLEIAGELRIPASGANAYAARHVYRPSNGIKARSSGELLRKSRFFRQTVQMSGQPEDGN